MLIDKLLYQRRLKKELGLDEDYTHGPWIPPNDTTYVGFFFEKDVNSFPENLRKKYEKIKQEILQREEQYKKLYGDEWRNVAIHKAYRLMKETFENYETHAYLDETNEYNTYTSTGKTLVGERKLTQAELKKREEIAKAIERDNPDMPMDKKMAIATAIAKKVAKVDDSEQQIEVETSQTKQTNDKEIEKFSKWKSKK